MRPSTFRRLGATLLLALFLPSCADTPTALEPSREDGARLNAASGNSYRAVMEILPTAIAMGRAAAKDARSRGASPAEADAVAVAAMEGLLRQRGIQGRMEHHRAQSARARAQITADQFRYMAEIKSAVSDLGPAVSVAELEQRLESIERRAKKELHGPERESIMMAIAAVTEFWRANAVYARMGLTPAQAVGLNGLGVGERAGPVLFYSDGDGFSWGGFAHAVVDGVVVGALTGAIAGLPRLGGPGVITGAIGGALIGGVTGAWEYYHYCCYS